MNSADTKVQKDVIALIKGNQKQLLHRTLHNLFDNSYVKSFSSREPSGSQGELIVYPCSVVRPSVRRPTFSKIFFSETAWPIKAKFYMKHLWEGGTNVYINNPGHMTKMAAMPIYGKNPSKIFFSGTTGPISTKLGMKHR